MSAGETLKAPGFVLRTYSYGESDLIVSFYTRPYGKIRGIAKGAKRSKKRFANVFEPFSLADMIFLRKNRDGLVFIESCDMIDHFDGIREDLEKTLTASYFIDLLDHFSPEGKSNESLFFLVADFLSMLKREKVTEAMIRFYEMRLLKIAGFLPSLETCVRCKAPLTNGNAYYFYPKEGGILCSACASPQRYDLSVSPGTLRTLLLGRDMEIDRIKQVCLADGIAAESRNLLCGFISHIIGKEVKSLKVMEQVRRFCP